MTDHDIEFASYPDRLPDRVLKGKEPLCRVVGQDNDLFAAVARSEPATPANFQSIEFEVIFDASHQDGVGSPVSQTQLEAIVSGAPIVLYATDRDGIFTLSEGSGLSLLGLEPGQVIDRYTVDER